MAGGKADAEPDRRSAARLDRAESDDGLDETDEAATDRDDDGDKPEDSEESDDAMPPRDPETGQFISE